MRAHTFKFTDEELNDRLIALLRKRAAGRYTTDRNGVVKYSHDDEDFIGNELICAVRSSRFTKWQIVSFPEDWAESYARYMHAHSIPYHGELRDGQLRFLIPRRYRPHSWKLEQPVARPRRRAVS